jgi:hypothetical protein
MCGRWYPTHLRRLFDHLQHLFDHLQHLSDHLQRLWYSDLSPYKDLARHRSSLRLNGWQNRQTPSKPLSLVHLQLLHQHGRLRIRRLRRHPSLSTDPALRDSRQHTTLRLGHSNRDPLNLPQLPPARPAIPFGLEERYVHHLDIQLPARRQ